MTAQVGSDLSDGDGFPAPAGGTVARRSFQDEADIESLVMSQAGADFHESAVAAVSVEVKRYMDDLIKSARDSRSAEGILTVDPKHVAMAVDVLRPRPTVEVFKILSDWAKRIGFLFIGFCVVQFNVVHKQKPIAPGSVNWLVVDAIVASGLVVAGAFLDWIARKLRARRGR